jgi:hypothetical protein
MSWDCIASWKMELPVRMRVPVPVDLAVAAACLALAFGVTGSRPLRWRWVSLGMLILIGFYGMLRPTEIWNLRTDDIIPAGDVRLPGVSTVVLRILDPKNRAFMGREQFVMIEETATVAWLTWWVEHFPLGSRLFQGTRSAFESMFRELFCHLGCGGLGVTLGSLRTGGTTFFYTKHCSMSWLQFRGRWKSQASLLHYVQEGMAALVGARIPPAAIALVRVLCCLEPRLRKFLLAPAIRLASHSRGSANVRARSVGAILDA